ncbi:MAG: hypothetical protein A2X12_11755 [Bacteroidetes bacterium GWE2_29_8]|nr:MAG: hypothetical protein A2X12_11755 [Bacteroidetes bacterium GWE2_29_8]OFY20333.1 MAG: hypothetical protein A2X02_01095 [Bacteroidetes bacterium GWF2_29_10]
MTSKILLAIGILILIYIIIKISKIILRLLLIIVLLMAIYWGYKHYIKSNDKLKNPPKELIYDNYEENGKFKS